MKAPNLTLLVRGLLASVLLSLGFVGVSQLLDPVSPPASQKTEEMSVAGGCQIGCNYIEKPGDTIG